MSFIRQGYVVATHPEDHSVDLVMADDGSRLVGVQVVTPNGSGRTGKFDMPAVPEKADKWDITKRTDQDQIAMVGFVGRHPVVLGFLYPQVNQMVFGDPKRRIERHQSDVYSTVDGNGNMELFHPSGTYVRIAEDPAHEDLVGKNTDAKLAIDRNTAKRVHFHIEMARGVASVDIDPDGKIVVTADRNVEVNTKQQAIVNADSDVIVNTGADADVRVAGNASVVSQGWGQFVGSGPVLIKSEQILKLKGPSGEIIL